MQVNEFCKSAKHYFELVITLVLGVSLGLNVHPSSFFFFFLYIAASGK